MGGVALSTVTVCIFLPPKICPNNQIYLSWQSVVAFSLSQLTDSVQQNVEEGECIAAPCFNIVMLKHGAAMQNIMSKKFSSFETNFSNGPCPISTTFNFSECC
ncbi:hypothetical protein XENOCAPTIV_007986 [Xenoophorus captivus]|uniref:Uncharacterized protein n=1 Tax=Xenoophorus captivus TaxID=1517983 RepID=A0ABV0QV38_9TELE